MPDAGLLDRIRGVLDASPFHGQGHHKGWARLRFAGLRMSRHRVLRLMREHELLAPALTGSPRGSRNHDGMIIPETVDVVWGDPHDDGLDPPGPDGGVHRLRPPQRRMRRGARRPHGTRFKALEPVRQGVREHFGSIARGVPRDLSV